MTEGKVPARLRLLALLCALMFAALGTRLWFMQVLASEQYRKEARQNGIRLVSTVASRGRIYDRNGDLLVDNRPSLTVLVNRQQLGDSEEKVVFRLSKLLHLPIKEIVQRLKSTRYYVYTPVPIASDVPKRVALYIGEHQKQLPGVSYAVLPVRRFHQGKLAAQVLGYTGEISPAQLKSPEFHGYTQGDIVGQNGVEATYERWLQGHKGERKFKVNSSGKNLGPIGSVRASVPGDDVVLSIDANVQRLAQYSLVQGEEAARHIVDTDSGRYLAADAGAVIVMNPKNGQILALASNPAYDPRVFEDRSSKRFRALNQPSRHYPLLDRAIQAEYPAGSTFKPFVALSALRRGIASPSGFYPCPPVYHVPGDPNTVFYNWSSSDYGSITLSEALRISCDTVFYNFGWQYWVRYADSGPGPEHLDQYKGRSDELQPDLRSFGFDRPTGIDLPYETDGRIPDPEWKADIHRQDPKNFPYGIWLPGDYINMSIGQGDALVTPLQLASAYSAIANGGRVCVPHVGLEIQQPGGKVVKKIHPRCERRLPFSADQLAYVRQALTQVPVSGTAEQAFAGFPFSQVPVAGKTGTAEVNPHQPYSWFAAMAPAYDPQYVVVALVEQGGHGSTTAAPIVRRILEGLFHLTATQVSTGGSQD